MAELSLVNMPLDECHSTLLIISTNNKSTLVQVMAWCRRATSHYLGQCWLRSLSPHGVTRPQWVKSVIFKLLLWIHICSYSYVISLRGMPQNPFDDNPTLVQVMAWCRQAASHYLSRCWPRSMSPYGITRHNELIILNGGDTWTCPIALATRQMPVIGRLSRWSLHKS